MTTDNCPEISGNPVLDTQYLRDIMTQNNELLKVMTQLLQLLTSQKSQSCCCCHVQPEATFRPVSVETPAETQLNGVNTRSAPDPMLTQSFVKPPCREGPSARVWYNNSRRPQSFHTARKFCGYCKKVGHTMSQCRYRPFCQYCGKRGHIFEDCYEKKNQCLYCQQQGHVVQNCPVKNNRKVGCPFCQEEHLGKNCRVANGNNQEYSVLEALASVPESSRHNETHDNSQCIDESPEKQLANPIDDLVKGIHHLKEKPEETSGALKYEPSAPTEVKHQLKLPQAGLLGKKTCEFTQPIINEGIPEPSADPHSIPISTKEPSVKEQPIVNVVKERLHLQESPKISEKPSQCEPIQHIDKKIELNNHANKLDENFSVSEHFEIIHFLNKPPKDPWFFSVNIGEGPNKLRALVDTRMGGNFIKASPYHKMNQQKFPLRQRKHLTVVQWDNSSLPILGDVTFSFSFASGFSLENQSFIVLPDEVSDYDLILGFHLLEDNELYPAGGGQLVGTSNSKWCIVASIDDQFKLCPPV